MLMCTYYWNLQTTLTCPNCSQTAPWELQTHFMGDIVSYANVYTVGQRVKELAGVSVLLDGKNDDFIGDCPKCRAYFDVGAQIVAGKVERAFFLPQQNREKPA